MEDIEKRICEKFKIKAMHPYQLDTIKALIAGRDAWVSKKTGAGKSLCYQAYSTALNSQNEKCMVIVVSPLSAIQKEQCDYLKSLGLKACIIGHSEEENQALLCGDMEYVFGSPEQLLGDTTWRTMIKSAGENGYLKLFAIDEAHLVLQWGESSLYAAKDEAFRPWFSKLGELRSLASRVPIIALTATANKTHRLKIQKRLNMRSPDEIIDNPDRSNVKLSMVKFSTTTNLTEMFAWQLDMLHEKGAETPRTLVFTKTIDDASRLYNMCLMDGTIPMPYVEMFHSMTPDAVKEKIRIDMANSEGTIRVLYCTNAAGLGVNYKNIKYVINYGPPQDMDTFLQHIGRAGRTGDQAQHLLMYTGRQVRNLTPDMVAYIKNTDTCRREVQLRYYKSKPEGDRIQHLCCDICEKICECASEDCEEALVHPAIEFLRQEEYIEEQPTACRQVDDMQRDTIQAGLSIYAENLSEGQDLLPVDLFGVSEGMINVIVYQLEYITKPEDLLTKCGVPSFHIAMDMFSIVCDILDIAKDEDVEDMSYMLQDD